MADPKLFSMDWCMKMAGLEGNAEIGAGKQGEREAFERLADECGQSVERDDGAQDGPQRDPTGYVSDMTMFGWIAWQARAAGRYCPPRRHPPGAHRDQPRPLRQPGGGE